VEADTKKKSKNCSL